MDDLKRKYFSDSKKVIYLKKDEFLFQKGDVNRRLFWVESGMVKGFDPDDHSEYFQVNRGDFVGLNSFFSKSMICRMSIIALEDSTLRYLEENIYSDNFIDNAHGHQIAYNFMPLVVQLLLQRQKQMNQAALEYQDVLKKMKEVERLASLGQLSAGVAHELNNAITVIARGSSYISTEVLENLGHNEIEQNMMSVGVTKGRVVSSAQARKIARTLFGKSDIPEYKLRDYARTGMIEQFITQDEKDAQRAFDLWNLGATLHDLQMAVKQSEHVVNSMRSLASSNVVCQGGCDINESIQKALFLLSNPLNNVELSTELGKIDTVFGNSGELVQIWSNIIKNAIDAMEKMDKQDSRLLVKSEMVGSNVWVIVKDSGPGITDEMIQEIFKPHVTTKKTGQTFGLGLGLTIVQKIINRYSGDLRVESSKSGTTFRILIPIVPKDMSK